MYIPSHFTADANETDTLLANIGAADLVVATASGLLSAHIPMLYYPGQGDLGVLKGHLAKANSQIDQPVVGEAMVIVHGVSSYVSPSFYPSKAKHGKVVPTWNYTIAHVYGELVLHDDPDWLLAHVTALTERHEEGFDAPWSVSDAPSSYITAMLGAIVGVEVRISRIEAKVKLSQNREASDVEGVIEGLYCRGDKIGSQAVANAKRARS